MVTGGLCWTKEWDVYVSGSIFSLLSAPCIHDGEERGRKMDVLPYVNYPVIGLFNVNAFKSQSVLLRDRRRNLL